MKGYAKMMIAGATIIIIGLIIFTVFCGLNGWRFNPDYEMKTYECDGDVSKLTIDLYAGSIKTVYADVDKVTVEYPESEQFSTNCTYKDGVLDIGNGKKHWYNFLWFGQIPLTTVSIPKNLKIDLNVHLNAGSADISGADYDTVSLYLNAGGVEIGNSSCKSFTCEINAGGVSTGNIACDKFYVKLNAGAFECKSLECPDIEAKMNAGSVSMKIIGIKSEYTISVDKNAGSCNVDNSGGTTGKRLNVKINAGSFDARFTN